MILVENLTKRFGPTPVLNGASLDVQRGELAVLIGPSGGGKSTLLRCMNGLETFDAGRLEVAGRTMHPGPQDRAHAGELMELRRSVGMVFQQFNLFPHMSVLQNVMCGPLYAQRASRDAAAAKAKALLARVGMADFADRRPANLSGGQQQRVAIARALANEPQVMLFDEPTSALDPRMTAEVLAVMADLASSGQTMVVVTHAMGFARKSARRIHVLAGGIVVESGPPAQIFEAAKHPETRALLAESEA